MENALSRWMWSRSGLHVRTLVEEGGLKKKNERSVLEVTGIHREFIQHDIDPCDRWNI